jgi:ligand-binding sensor domain-containing protein
MMMQDGGGTIWLASKKGLGRLDTLTNNVTWFTLPATHTTGVPFFINKIEKQNNSTLWLSTDGGLFSFNKNTSRFSRYTSYSLGNAWKAFDDCTDVLFISDTMLMIASRMRPSVGDSQTVRPSSRTRAFCKLLSPSI